MESTVAALRKKLAKDTEIHRTGQCRYVCAYISTLYWYTIYHQFQSLYVVPAGISSAHTIYLYIRTITILALGSVQISKLDWILA